MKNNGPEKGEGISARSGDLFSSNILIAASILLSVTACASTQNSDALINPVSSENQEVKPQQKSEKVEVAERFYNEGKFGNAEQAYRLAIEENPYSISGWLGLAATYDNLKKFENANRAYMFAVKLGGYTPEILNNLGYHYILRGDYDKARKALTAADKKQPNNPFIQNNLKLLEKYEGQEKNTEKLKPS